MFLQLKILFLINIFDGISTFFLMHTGEFKESNPLLNYVSESPGGILFVKIFATCFLIGTIHFILKCSPKKSLSIFPFLLKFSLAVYGMLFFYHIYCWINYLAY